MVSEARMARMARGAAKPEERPVGKMEERLVAMASAYRRGEMERFDRLLSEVVLTRDREKNQDSAFWKRREGSGHE